MQFRRLWWLVVLGVFALGLAIGWLAIGWGLWPVPPSTVAASGLADAPRAEYLQMVAETFAANGNVADARARLTSWPREQLARDLADLEELLQEPDPKHSSQIASLERALIDFELPTEAPIAIAQAALVTQASPTPTLTLIPSARPSATAATIAANAPTPTQTARPSRTPTAAPSPTPTLQPTDTPEPLPSESPTPAPTPRSLKNTENFLVLGADTRSNMAGWRTDSIMIVAIDRAAGQVGILSIPRDLYVDIPGYGKERINATDYIGERSGYPGGGPALLQRVVEATTGIPTQHWAIMKQEGLVKLVDALGGVSVTLDCPLYEMAPEATSPTGYKQFTLPAGKSTLDGAAAKKFATYRYITGDFGRERRQQQLIWAIRNRALKGDVIPRIPQLWTALSDTFSTDMNMLDVISLATFGLSFQSKNVHATTLPRDMLQDYTTPAGAMVLLVRDRAAILGMGAKLFSANAIADVGKPAASQGCPAPPRGFKDLSSRPTAKP